MKVWKPRRPWLTLKREDTRFRDWNSRTAPIPNSQAGSWKEKILDYEIETFSGKEGLRFLENSWKEKILDYEIETTSYAARRNVLCCTWKEKILDYEIETRQRRRHKRHPNALEKRRYSITRLKPKSRVASASVISASLKREDTRLRDWNVRSAERSAWCSESLEKRRYSITRLKRTVDWRFRPMSRKLEKRRYSIPRLKRGSSPGVCRLGDTWKEKILDYEIETYIMTTASIELDRLEKRRYSIPRLKLIDIGIVPCDRMDLKREDTRLRDWNCRCAHFDVIR